MGQHALAVQADGWRAAAGGPVAAADAPDKQAVQQDRKRYEGTWRVVSLEVNGVKAPSADAGRITVVNQANDAWTVRMDGKVVARGVGRIDPMQNPKAIDLPGIGEGGKGRKFLGIYALEGDSRKLCYALPGKDRPTEFSSPPGSGHILVVLQREKK